MTWVVDRYAERLEDFDLRVVGGGEARCGCGVG